MSANAADSVMHREALAAGTPVIATRVGGLEELVGGLDQRLLVDASAGAIAERVSDLAAAPDAWPGREECAAYAARYEWAEIAGRLQAVYREAPGP